MRVVVPTEEEEEIRLTVVWFRSTMTDAGTMV
jgi:hypothetical protein